MGDKNLKAIAVYGTKDVSIAKPARLIELCEHILSRTDPVRTGFAEYFGCRLFRTYARIAGYGNFVLLSLNIAQSLTVVSGTIYSSTTLKSKC